MSSYKKQKQEMNRAIGITLLIGLATVAFVLITFLYTNKANAVDFKALSREAQADAKQFQSQGVTMGSLKGAEGVKALENEAATGEDKKSLEGLRSKCGNAGCSELEGHAAQQVAQDEELSRLHNMAATREKMDFNPETDPIFNAERQLMSQEENQEEILAGEFQDCTIERQVEGGTFSTQTCMSWAKPEDVSCNRKLEYDCSKNNGDNIQLISTPAEMPWSYNKNTGALRLGASGNTFNSTTTLTGFTRTGVKQTFYGAEKSTFNTKFRINNLTAITSFLMTTANFKEYVRVSVNGKQVYIGPVNGNRLEVIPRLYEGERYCPNIMHCG